MRLRPQRLLLPGQYGALMIACLAGTVVGVPTATRAAEPNDTLAEATVLGTLDLAQPLLQAGTIGDGNHPDMDVDYYEIQLPDALGTVLLTTNALTTETELDLLLRLFDGSGAELARNDDRAFGETHPQIKYLLLTPGTYFIGVSDAFNPYADPSVAGSGRETGALGAYQVSAHIVSAGLPESEYEPNDEIHAAGNVGDGSVSIMGEIIGDGPHGALDVDIYRFDVTGAARIDVRVRPASGELILNPVLRVRSCEDSVADKQPLDPCGLGESVPLGSVGGEATVSTVVFDEGTYFVLVSGEGNRRYDPAASASGEPGSMGAYDLDIVVTSFLPYGPHEPNESVSQATAQPFPFIDGRPSTITYESFLGDGPYALTRGDRDFYQIVVADEDRFVSVEVVADDPVSGLRPVVAAYDQNQQLIAVDKNAGETPIARLALPVVCNVSTFAPYPVHVMVMSTRQDWPGDPGVPIQPDRGDAHVDLTSGRGAGTTGGYQLHVTAAPVEEPCGNEPNDTIGNAVETGLVDQGAWACFGGYLGDSACTRPAQDVDLYSVEVDQAPAHLKVAVSSCAPEAVAVCNFGVAIVDSTGTFLGRFGGEGNCVFAMAVPPVLLPSAGTYYVGVYGSLYGTFDPHAACSVGPISDAGSYGLSLSLTPGRLGSYPETTAAAASVEPQPVDELFATRMYDAANQIDVLDPETLLPIRTIPAPEPGFGGMEGLASDGIDLYYLGTGRYPLLYRLDPTDGSILEKTLLWMGSGFYCDATILQNTLYIMDFGAHAIHLFDLAFQRYTATWPVGWSNGVILGGGLAAMEGPNRLFAADAFSERAVYELHPRDGSIVRTIDPASSTDQRPVSLASDGAGNLLMADRASDTVDVIERDGAALESLTLDTPVASIGGLSVVAGNGDINGDGNVDQLDYAVLQSCFGLGAGLLGPDCAQADLNEDGMVDAVDAGLLVTTFTGP